MATRTAAGRVCPSVARGAFVVQTPLASRGPVGVAARFDRRSGDQPRTVYRLTASCGDTGLHRMHCRRHNMPDMYAGHVRRMTWGGEKRPVTLRKCRVRLRLAYGVSAVVARGYGTCKGFHNSEGDRVTCRNESRSGIGAEC